MNHISQDIIILPFSLIQSIYINQMNKNTMKTLIKNSINLVNTYNHQQPLQFQVKNQNILNYLNFSIQQLNLIQYKDSSAIGIRNLFQHPLLRLTIYYLPLGTTMKLHDHNQMKVISKILQGKMQAKLYHQKQGNIYQKSIKVLNQGQVMYIDGNRGYNLHQFKSLEPTYFLDIIFPDYSLENDCTFFEQKQEINQTTVKLKQVKGVQVIFVDI